jgi:diguanylate cyclase (GGDEF)-like protein
MAALRKLADALRPRPDRGAAVAIGALLLAGLLALGNSLLLPAMAEREMEARLSLLAAALAEGETPPPMAGLVAWQLRAPGEAPAEPPGAAAGTQLLRRGLPGGVVLEARFDTSPPARLAAALVGLELLAALLGALGLALVLRRWAPRGLALARGDVLTGLPGQEACQDRLEAALSLGRRRKWLTGLLVLDIRGFGDINALHGRAAADDALREVARRLRAGVRREDWVMRLAGDRFAVVQTGLAEPAGAMQLAERLAAAIARPVIHPRGRLVCAADIGIAIAPTDGTEAGPLIARAEEALAQARTMPIPAIRCAAPGQDAVLARRRRLAGEMRAAIADGRFQLHWQPQRRLSDRRLIGFEALLRWQHPELGMVPPDEFIPLAENSGLIVPLGAWVLRSAAVEAARWPDGIGVAVNLSPVQMRVEGFMDTVAEALSLSGLNPRRLELEVTESTLVREPEQAARLLRELKSLGLGLAMDDFGTGWSSLAHLRRYPFGKLKIDRAFIRDLPQDERALALVGAILAMGRALNMQVVAEGVETEEHLRLLLGQGCAEAQGWLLGRPVPTEAARALIAEEMRIREKAGG